MDYMNEVRIAFMDDAAQSPDALHGKFRSPALDYYLSGWITYPVALTPRIAKTYKRLMGWTFNMCRIQHVLIYLCFSIGRAYHDKQCNEHDCCGALQGCGTVGEDVQKLLDAVDVSLVL
ncbi:hypothetical protein DEU56DRAFT_919920 [Suillus clintonianus]|uniref:uncharacterized protein n=1 Tax=Suillus clintonianus TaxID=1904413 RepID=UPI001B87CB7A|nr:uncharacterized protein DEU56DRAFT_919920 [Suillus clintonianus]KAG2112097.1 hypothetical protein DEU56DRAFT_919920 [Suillus clintonianus]